MRKTTKIDKTLKTTSDFTTALTSALYLSPQQTIYSHLKYCAFFSQVFRPLAHHFRRGGYNAFPSDGEFSSGCQDTAACALINPEVSKRQPIWCPIAMLSFSLYISNELTGRIFAGRDRPRQQSEPGRLERGHLNSANRTHWKAFGTLSDVQLGVHIRICIPQASLLGSNNYRLGYIGGYGQVGSNSYNFPSQPPTPPLCALIDGHAPSSTCTPFAFGYIYPPGCVGIPEGYQQCWVGTLTA